MFESQETHAIETIYLKCKCGAEFNRECISEAFVGYVPVGALPKQENPRHRKYLAELTADEWLEFHENCYI